MKGTTSQQSLGASANTLTDTTEGDIAIGSVTSVNAANANTSLPLTGCKTVNSIGSWSSCQSPTSSGEQPSPAHRCHPKFLELPFEHARRHWHHEQQRTYSPGHHRRHLADCGPDNFGDQAMSRSDHPSNGDKAYHAIKRRGMRLCCLFGRHDFKMGAPAKTGGGFGCLWCGAKARPTVHKSRGEVDKNLTNSRENSTENATDVVKPVKTTPKTVLSIQNRYNRNEIDPLLAMAERQVRRLFGGKL